MFFRCTRSASLHTANGGWRPTRNRPIVGHMKRREERGQAMVEFTLIATVLATLLLAVFQFGVAFSNYINVTDAARAAARKASTYGASSTYNATTEATSRVAGHRVLRGRLRAHVRRRQLVHDARRVAQLGRRQSGRGDGDGAVLDLDLRAQHRIGDALAHGHHAYREPRIVSRRRSERGQTAVEFALVIPVMLLFLLGIFQIGITYFNNESIATAARDGARAGAIHTGSTPRRSSRSRRRPCRRAQSAWTSRTSRSP